MSYAFPPPAVSSVAIQGSEQRFPVHRIYCVGRNYAAHAKEMGGDPTREPPFFFTKPRDAVVANRATIPFPPRTSNLHHEIELVVAIGRAGKNIDLADARDHIFGYAVGNDLTRRDLQFQMRDNKRPWDIAKGFDNAAPIGSIRPVANGGHLERGRIWLKVNDALRQESDIAAMIWNVPEIVAELSTLFELAPGDLIYTGTPEGVGPLSKGDRIEGGIEGLETLVTAIEK